LLVPTLDDIADRACAAAGADFAFVLTRKGRLVTRNAPKDMSEAGRGELVEVAETVLGQRRGFAHHEMPRQSLVPYGGAAPVDVYVAAREEAILCVVLATYTAKSTVSKAMAQAIVELDALLESEAEKRSRRRGAGKSRPPSSKGSMAPPRGKSVAPPSSKGSVAPPRPRSSRKKTLAPPPPALDFEDRVAGRGTVPFLAPLGPRRTPPPLPPDISLAEAALGRSSLAAIEVDADAPEITYGMAPLGRRTIAEIEMSMLPPGDPRSSAPTIRVDLESAPKLAPNDLTPLDRQTLPFTASPADMKQDFEAAQKRLAGGATPAAATTQRTVIVGRSAPRGAADVSARASRTRFEEVVIDVEDDSPTLQKRLPPVPRPRPEVRDTTPDEGPDIEVDDPPTKVKIGSSRPAPDPDAAPVESALRPKNPRDSGIDDWHKALSELVPKRKGATGFALGGKKAKPRK
jgi:hypothetical protein